VLADGKRLLVALAGEGGFVIVDPKKGGVTGVGFALAKARTFSRSRRRAALFLSDRIASTISLVDTQETKDAFHDAGNWKQHHVTTWLPGFAETLEKIDPLEHGVSFAAIDAVEAAGARST
jgi:hypothetical protein